MRDFCNGARSFKNHVVWITVKDDAADLDAVFHDGQHSAVVLACQALSFAEPVGLAPHPPKKLGCGIRHLADCHPCGQGLL